LAFSNYLTLLEIAAADAPADPYWKTVVFSDGLLSSRALSSDLTARDTAAAYSPAEGPGLVLGLWILALTTTLFITNIAGRLKTLTFSNYVYA